jgi:hypoxanthine phosphoribosyltransferase
MKDDFRNDIAEVLIQRKALAARVKALAGEIAGKCGSDSLTVVPVLSGAMIFTADLIRELPLKMKINLINVSSYAGETTDGEDPKILHALTADLSRRPVLIVDDILDTGRTLARVVEYVRGFEPADLRTVVLLRKKRRRAASALKPDFVGFDVPDKFVVGYGLDYNGLYRNLPEIAVLRKELYAAG